MKKVFGFCFLLCSFLLTGQEYVHQIIVVNEGYYDYQTSSIIEPVTVGVFDPVSNIYTTKDTLNNMRFASDAIIDGNFLYIAADSKIFKFDLNTFELIGSVNYLGVRNLGIWGDNLIATRGEYLTTFDSYLHIFDKNNLSVSSVFDTIVGPKWSTQNIVLENNTAYILVNNAYEWGNEKGLVGQLNLETMTYGNEIDLGPEGKNPDNLFLKSGFLYTVNNKDWTGASVSKIDLLNLSVQTNTISNAVAGCGTSALRDENIVYQISMENTLNKYDVSLMNNVGPILNHNLNYYELIQNPLDGNLYASETDFTSYGNIHVFNNLDEELFSFQTNVSPGIIVFDVRNQTGSINDPLHFNLQLSPNPVTHAIHINSNQNSFFISDLFGKVLITSNSNSIDVSTLSEGMYYVTDDTGRKAPFIKSH